MRRTHVTRRWRPVPGVGRGRRLRDRTDALFRHRQLVGVRLYWVISITMVGLAASGVVLSLFKDLFVSPRRAPAISDAIAADGDGRGRLLRYH